MTTLIDPKLTDDTDIIGSRMARIDPDNFRNDPSPRQSDRTDGPFAMEDNEDNDVDQETPASTYKPSETA